MPSTSVDQLGKRIDALQSTLSGQGEGADVATKRRLTKQIKRAQRKRRRLMTEEDRVKAAAAKAAEAQQKAKEAAEAKAKTSSEASAALSLTLSNAGRSSSWTSRILGSVLRS